MAIDLHRVTSGAITRLGYDAATATLVVEYASGGLYHYAGVPKPTYDALRSAPSIGAYLSQYIRPHHQGVRQEVRRG